MQRFGISLIIVAIGLWAGCGKDAPDPSIFSSDSTICILLKLESKVPSVPANDYTVSFKYDSEGKLDTTYVEWVGTHTAIKYHYSVDDHPDSLSVTFTYPPNMQGNGYRVYFGYDSDRHVIFTSDNNVTTHYTYNSHGQLVRRLREGLLNGVQHSDSSRYYYPNSTTHNYDRLIPLVTGPVDTTRFTYDNHPIPLKFPLGAPFPTEFQPNTDNNMLKAITTCCGVVQEYTYTYNSAGYPIEQVFGAGFATTTYTYKCVTVPNPE